MVTSDNIAKQAGHYELHSFMVSNYSRSKRIEMKTVIHAFMINESMSTGSVRGSATIYDTQDNLRKFPFIGEEFVDITYSDFYGTKLTENYFVYAVTDVKYGGENNQGVIQYTLHFVSVGKIVSDDLFITKAYKPQPNNQGLITDYVNEVFDEYYHKPVQELQITPKSLIPEETQGQQIYVVPKLSPEQTMHFFSRKAFKADSKTHTFRFFESRKYYFFATNEYMIERLKPNAGAPAGGPVGGQRDVEIAVPVFRRNMALSNMPNRQLALMSELVSIDFGDRIHTVEDTARGGYRRKTYEVDIMNNSVTVAEYNHTDEYSEPNLKLPHTKEFIDARMTRSTDRYIAKDYASPGAPTGYAIRPETFYTDIYNKKAAEFYHYGRNRISVSIYGRNTLFAGSVIELDLFVHKAISTEADLEKDKEYSGRWIVESVENVFFENTYTQKLVLSRSGVGK